MQTYYVSVPYSGLIRVNGSIQVEIEAEEGLSDAEAIALVQQKGARFVRRHGNVVQADDESDGVSIESIGTDEPAHFWRVSDVSRVSEFGAD